MKKVSHDGGFRILLKKNLRDFDGQVIRKLGGKVNVLSESVRVFKVSETIRSITECYYATRLTVGCIPNCRSWYHGVADVSSYLTDKIYNVATSV